MDNLWQKALVAFEKGNFTLLQAMLGGPTQFDERVVEWHKKGMFDDEPEALTEAFACACMLGRTETARYLLEHSVDPYAGMKTGIAGSHYAASGGHLDTVKMLLEKKIPLEVRNMYGGTVLGQALWSTINEHKDNHAEIIEALIDAGAEIEPGTLEWWQGQPVPSPETKHRVSEALRKAERK